MNSIELNLIELNSIEINIEYFSDNHDQSDYQSLLTIYMKKK